MSSKRSRATTARRPRLTASCCHLGGESRCQQNAHAPLPMRIVGADVPCRYPRRRRQDPSNPRPSNTTPPPLKAAGPSPGDLESRRRLYPGGANNRGENGADLEVVGDSIFATPPVGTTSTQAIEVPAVATQAADTQAIDRTLFFGESNFLTCVAGSGFGRQQPPSKPSQPTNRLVYPITEAINTKSSKAPTTKVIPISSARYSFLLSENAFTFPPPQVRLDVLRAYFRWFHPCFPVLDRAEIARTVENGEVSSLLLQAILFIGASYCDEETIQKMGFKDHPDAKAQHYQRARLLYDADWESNKVTVLQAIFLMSFWRAGPLNEKNTRYWLGSAISLAQTRGFHRA